MDNIIMNSVNSNPSDPHRLLLNLPDKINLKRSDKYVTFSNLSIYYTLNAKITKLKYHLWHEMKNLNYLMDHLPVSDIQDYFEHILKKYGEETGNPSIRTYLNKKENESHLKRK